MGRGSNDDATPPLLLRSTNDEIGASQAAIDVLRVRMLGATLAPIGDPGTRSERRHRVEDMRALITHLEVAVAMHEARRPEQYEEITARWQEPQIHRRLMGALLTQYNLDLAVIHEALAPARDASARRERERAQRRREMLRLIAREARASTRKGWPRGGKQVSVVRGDDAAPNFALRTIGGTASAPGRAHLRAGELRAELSPAQLLALGAEFIRAAAHATGATPDEAAKAAGLI